jgi:MFS-type transporter involved in bile tolerance (Atg22 family)
MLMVVTGADGLAAGELMVSQSVAAALVEFAVNPTVGQLSDSRGRRRVLFCCALGSAALRGLVVLNPCLATVWIAKLGDALV